MEGRGPLRVAKSHTALEALTRGSAAYKQRLKKKAFDHVKRCRAAILARARGADFGRNARRELQRVIDDEVSTMELEDWGETDEVFADFPPSAYDEYEEFLYSLCLQLERDEEAEHYAEYEQFDEEALLDAIQHLTLEPMDLTM